MGFSINDYRNLFDNQQKEYKFYKACIRKYGNLDEDFLKSQADRYTKFDWYIISYFANISKKFIESFKEELEPALIRSNKYISPDIKKSCLVLFESTSTIYELELNRYKKLKIVTYPADWV